MLEKYHLPPQRIIGWSSQWVNVGEAWAMICVGTGLTLCALRGKTPEWTEFSSAGDPDGRSDVSLGALRVHWFWVASGYCVCICVCACLLYSSNKVHKGAKSVYYATRSFNTKTKIAISQIESFSKIRIAVKFIAKLLLSILDKGVQVWSRHW